MSILDCIISALGIGITIFLIVFFYWQEINSRVFPRLGFTDSKEDLYAITFQKFDFDYSLLVSGIDNNENQENMISDAIKKIDTENTFTIKKVDYFA